MYQGSREEAGVPVLESSQSGWNTHARPVCWMGQDLGLGGRTWVGPDVWCGHAGWEDFLQN